MNTIKTLAHMNDTTLDKAFECVNGSEQAKETARKVIEEYRTAETAIKKWFGM